MLVMLRQFRSDSTLKWITFVNFCLLVGKRFRHGDNLREVGTALKDALEVWKGQAFRTVEDLTQFRACHNYKLISFYLLLLEHDNLVEIGGMIHCLQHHGEQACSKIIVVQAKIQARHDRQDKVLVHRHQSRQEFGLQCL